MGSMSHKTTPEVHMPLPHTPPHSPHTPHPTHPHPTQPTPRTCAPLASRTAATAAASPCPGAENRLGLRPPPPPPPPPPPDRLLAAEGLPLAAPDPGPDPVPSLYAAAVRASAADSAAAEGRIGGPCAGATDMEKREGVLAGPWSPPGARVMVMLARPLPRGVRASATPRALAATVFLNAPSSRAKLRRAAAPRPMGFCPKGREAPGWRAVLVMRALATSRGTRLRITSSL